MITPSAFSRHTDNDDNNIKAVNQTRLSCLATTTAAAAAF